MFIPASRLVLKPGGPTDARGDRRQPGLRLPDRACDSSYPSFSSCLLSYCISVIKCSSLVPTCLASPFTRSLLERWCTFSRTTTWAKGIWPLQQNLLFNNSRSDPQQTTSRFLAQHGLLLATLNSNWWQNTYALEMILWNKRMAILLSNLSYTFILIFLFILKHFYAFLLRGKKDIDHLCP